MDKLDIKFLNSHSQIRKYCKNSTNSIEDPIFTGFTMSIDTLHSPLFKVLCEKEFDDTLRSPEGREDTTGGKISISNSIEEQLKKVYGNISSNINTYGISSIKAKDSFSSNNRRKPGYGLQEWHYLDEVLYGAADYIYMVDKIKVSQGAFGPDQDTERLGGGVPNDVLQSPDIEFVQNQEQGQGQEQEQDKSEESESNINNIYIRFNRSQSAVPGQVTNTDALDELIETLTVNPNYHVTLIGYASKDGNLSYNLGLSKDRVNAVRTYITSNGIEDTRISGSTGQGETDTFGKGDDEEIRKNNRVVICKFNVIETQADEARVEEQVAKDEAQSAEAAVSAEEQEQIASISDPDIVNVHNRNLIELYGKDGYGNPLTKETADENSIYKTYDRVKKDLEIYEKNKKEFEEKIAKEIEEFNKELNSFRSYMNNCLNTLSGNTLKMSNNLNTPNVDKDSVRNDINDVYEEFTDDFLDNFDENGNLKKDSGFKYITVNIKINNDLLSVNKLTPGLDSSDQIYAAKCYVILDAKIEGPIENSDAIDIKLQYQENINEQKKLMYGSGCGSPNGAAKDENGNPFDANNPSENSLYTKYNQLLTDLNTDVFAQKQEVLAEKEEKVETAKEKRKRERQERKEEKKKKKAEKKAKKNGLNTPEADTPAPGTPANENHVNDNFSRVYFEIPQTVYDMIGFKKDMLKIVDEHPYVFQSITGLDEAYKKYFEIKDPHMGSGDDKISIECLEFLDMRVSAMFNKYFNAVYDRQYRRERVPINLRRFNCSIFVHDIRNFRNSIDNMNVDLNQGDLNNLALFALNYMSAIEFKLFDCEIVPSETGSIFETVANNSAGDMRRTKFTFTYGNCIINFLPFDDLRRYVLERSIEDIQPGELDTSMSIAEANKNEEWGIRKTSEIDDGNTRRWFDKSDIGNVNNNDYREYVRKDSFVAVDDHYKTTVVNNFAAGSVAQKNKELTAMDDALRRMVVGISASTGIPAKGVVDSLNIGFLDDVLNGNYNPRGVIKEIGNVNDTEEKMITTKDENNNRNTVNSSTFDNDRPTSGTSRSTGTVSRSDLNSDNSSTRPTSSTSRSTVRTTHKVNEDIDRENDIINTLGNVNSK